MIKADRLTLKGQEAFRDAAELARRRGNPVVNDAHLFSALLDAGRGHRRAAAAEGGAQRRRAARGRGARDGPVPDAVGRRRGADVQPRAAQGLRPRRGRGQGRWATPTSPPSTCCSRWPRRRAPRRATLLTAAGVSSDELLRGAGGGARVASRHRPDARGAVPGAGALHPRPHRRGAQGKARSRSSAATRRSAASCRCCPGARRTTRCSSASRASARPRSSRGWRSGS